MSTDPEFCFTQLENDFHRNFSDRITSNIFVQNDEQQLMRHLDAYCAENDQLTNKPIVILGEVGSGKSAVLACWVRSRTNVANDDEHIFYHAIGFSMISSNVSHLLRRLEKWLLNQFNLKDDIDLSSNDQLPWILPRLLERASKKGNAIIVLDGLNHTHQSSLWWLPSKLPPNILLVVSSTSSSRRIGLDGILNPAEHSRKEQVKTQQICDEITRRNWPVLVMEPLSEENVRAIAAKHLSLHNDIEEHDEIVDILCSHPNANNPSFLTGVLRGLSTSVPDQDDMKQYLSCENTTQLVELMLAQVQGYEVGNTLSLLFVARHGLHEDELFDLLRMSNNEKPSFCDEDKKMLFDELCFVGVVILDTKFGRLLTLPVNDPTLRHVVWNKYITTAVKESEVRSLIVEYFERKDPSLRYCEELPWQQEKIQCPNLGQTLVDLRVIDIMYNTEALKDELFTFLSRLVASNNFDVVSMQNRAIQKWTVKAKPTSTQISMMAVFLGDVMLWFSQKAAQHSEMPPFTRDLDIPTGMLPSPASTTTTQQTQSGENYYYQRWLWCNWPFIALRVASKGLAEAVATEPTSPGASAVKNRVRCEEGDVALESTVRGETRMASLPASLQTKLDKITSSSDDSTTQQNTNATSAIPFSTSRFTQEVPRTYRAVSSEQKIRDAKGLLDALRIERSKRETRKRMILADHKVAGAALITSRQQHEQGKATIADLKSRYAKVKFLSSKAVSIESSLTDVVSAMEATDPANLRRHEEIEHEIALKSKELRGLKDESLENVERIDQIRKEVQSVKSLISSTLEEKGELEPLLTSLRDQVKELEERRKAALSKKFDSAKFTKRVKLVGKMKLAKRRADMQKRITVDLQSNVEVLANHPMMRLIEATGKKDAEEIVAQMHRDEEEGEILRSRQESAELELKDRRSRLDHLRNQIEELELADSFSRSGHESPSSMHMECTELERKQNQLMVISNLTKNVKIALLHLQQKAQLLVQNDQTLSIHGVINEGSSNVHEDAKRIAQSINDLVRDTCGEYSTSSQANETPSKYNNVRVLNKAEAESRFTESSSSRTM